jgi:hypothetical protein
MDIQQWVQDRDIAITLTVEKLDPEPIIRFMVQYEGIAYEPSLVYKFKFAKEKMQIATACKMACQCLSIDDEIKNKAREWLKQNNMSEDIK